MGQWQNNKRDYPKLIAGSIILAFMATFGIVAKDAFVEPSFSGHFETPCEIVSSHVERLDVCRFEFSAEFAYEHGGRKHKSTWLNKSGDAKFIFSRLEKRLPLLEEYAPGTKHACHVNPNSPNDAVLRLVPPYSSAADALNGKITRSGIMVFMAIFASFGFGMVVTSFPAVKKRLTKNARSIFGALFMMLFAVPFAGIGTFFTINSLNAFKADKTFVRVPARILYSGVSVHSSGGGRHHHVSYEPRIGYEYTFKGKKYESDRYSQIDADCGSRDAAQAVADAFMPGDVTDAYVSGEDPRLCALKRLGDSPFPLARIVMPAAFALIGYGLFASALFFLLKRAVGRDESDIAAIASSRMLKRTNRDVVFLCFFALVWNAIAWSIAFSVIRRPFEPPYALVALFPALGLGLAVHAVCRIMHEISAPKIQLAISRPSPTFAQLEWRLDDTDELESFEISLEGSMMVRSGRSPHSLVEKTKTLCRYEAPSIPSTWHHGFDLPAGDFNDSMTWIFVVRMKKTANKQPYEAKYSFQP